MAFQFGFAADEDTEVDDHDTEARPDAGHTTLKTARTLGSNDDAIVQEHKLSDLLKSLPERIAYSVVGIESPLGRKLHIPRRELYDVRVQLIAEGPENDAVVDQLEKSDLRSGVYEGGFKTWECSVDLASLLLDRGPRKDIDELIQCEQIIELGCGTALPSLVLFQHALKNSIPMTFTLADYNDTVLRLVTLPNFVLTWAAYTEGVGLETFDLAEGTKGDLELPQTLLERFTSDLEAKRINLHFVSGPWSPQLSAKIPSASETMGTVVLAAETIYSPQSTEAFVDLLLILLKRVKMSKAMVAAKRMYFGVGGSVDGLKEACAARGAVAYEIENHGVLGMDAGVGRSLMEVQMY